MESSSEAAAIALRHAKPTTRFIDRWKFVLTAAVILAVALIGFGPNALSTLNAAREGNAPPIPAILHLHAILMGSWLLLLAGQAALMALGQRRMHFTIGIIGFLLAPAIVLTGFFLVPVRSAELAHRIATAPPDVAADLSTGLVPLLSNILLTQIQAGIIFSILVAIALGVRRRDPATHKRLMFLATVAPLAAATDRIAFLPTTLPNSPLTMWLYPLLTVLPLFVWDLLQLRKVQRAYVLWLSLFLPTSGLVYLAWATPWWLNLAGQLFS